MLSGKRSDLQRLKDWIQTHHVEFKDLPAEDIAARAILHGFDLPLVRQWQQHQRWEQLGEAS